MNDRRFVICVRAALLPVWLVAFIAAVVCAQSGRPPDSNVRTGKPGTAARSNGILGGIQAIRYGLEDAEETEQEENMATPNYWISTTGVWDSTASWSLGHVPVTTELAVFDDLSQVNVTTPSVAASPADKIQVTDRYYGDIGMPGVPQLLTPAVASGAITIRGHGKYYIYGWHTVSMVMDSPDGELHLSGVYNWRQFIKRGKVYMDAACYYQGARVALYGHTAYLHIGTSSATTTSFPYVMTLHAGTVLNDDELGSAESLIRVFQTGGLWTQRGVIDTTTILVVAGGVFEYAPNASPAAESLHAYVNGVLDVTESRYAIPIATLVIGPQGEIRGSAVETASSLSVLDLRQDYP